MTKEILQQVLETLGYSEFKHPSKTTIIVLTNDNRLSVLQHIAKSLEGAHYDNTPTSQSSLGHVQWQALKILVKPASKQGRNSSYSQNEDLFVEQINKYANLSSLPLHIILDSGTRQERIENVQRAEAVGTDTKNRKKTDVRLTTCSGHYNISLKMDNASHWESADKYYKLKARAILEHLISNNQVDLIPTEFGGYKLSPTILVQATEAEARDVVFGSDIENAGSVVIKSFIASDFIYDKYDHTLIIRCTDIIKSLENLDLNNDVWFLIRNDSTRTDSILPGFKGLRVTAVNSSMCSKAQYKVYRTCRDKIIMG